MTKPKILVIDDEMGPRESLRILLKNEYTVLLADNVDIGVALLRDEQPDLVIMDIRMPGKNGIEGLKEIRALDSRVSVIMLTGYGALETAQEAVRLGANDYLRKPFDTSALLDIVRHNVRRTAVERRRQAAMQELQKLNAGLAEQLAEKEHLANVGHASAEFAHDFRNPLTIVMGYVDLLAGELESFRKREGGQPSETGEYLDIIEKNVHRCYELTQMWQRFARGETEQPEPVDLNELLCSCMQAVKPLAAVADADFALEMDKRDSKMVLGCRAELQRALHNILTNAVHALPERGGRLRLCLRESQTNAEIRVVDNGCGISKEVRERIFDAYYTTKQEGEGTGLGLSIARKIIEKHGGSIRLRSEVGHGTEVMIRLPLLPEKAALAAAIP